MTMISQDTIHSFYVPAFRIKRDVLPGRYSTAWFEATKTGTYHLFCAEYCGTEHSGMVGSIVVMEQREYEDWLSSLPNQTDDVIAQQSGNASVDSSSAQSMAGAGEVLFRNSGCATCHQMDGGGIGPLLAGLYNSQVRLEGGEVVTADADYIRRSILDPNAQIVEGYPPVMPTYADQLSEAELMRLVEYIQSMGTDGGAGVSGGEGDASQDGGDGGNSMDEGSTEEDATTEGDPSPDAAQGGGDETEGQAGSGDETIGDQGADEGSTEEDATTEGGQ